MEIQSHNKHIQQNMMLPPTPGTFEDREDLIKYVRDFGASQGYVVTIKQSRRERRVTLGCDRGGVYRNRRKIEESKRKRTASPRLINCPFEAIGKKDDDVWVLTIKNGEHNHEALKDMSEHPYSRRFTEEEVSQIKMMTEAGIKPHQVLKNLKKNNPEFQSTPRHLYNLKAKIRQGNLSEKSLKSWRPNRSALVDSPPLKVPNFIGGRFMDSEASTIVDVINPATQEVVSHVPLTTYEEFKAAVSAAKQAYSSWKSTPVTTRQRIMFKLYELILRDIDKFALNITIEQGKTLAGAKSDVHCGLEVLEHACRMAPLQMGEFVPNASSGIDTYCIREPLGVCAGICPFNFPAMISLWMFPIAVACGNTFILKPSEKNPGDCHLSLYNRATLINEPNKKGASMILAALAKEAGLPDGVLNIVHGTNDIVNHICDDDDDIKAISFFVSNMAGMHLYGRAAASGKRIQSNMGAKNHAIVMPDASIDATLSSLVAAGFGAAGQRCMALSTVVFVGGSVPWEEELVNRAKKLNVNAGIEHEADLGPVITKEVKDQICRLVESGVESGARLILDRRNIVVPRYEYGNFVGPTILCDVTTSMECYKEEVFGPVLLCMQADSLDDAIAIVNKNKYGYGASIFTTSGLAARKFQNGIEAGLVGINVPVPFLLPFSSFNGSKASFASDLNLSGKEGVQFYTRIKTVAQHWKDLPSPGALVVPMPPTVYTDITSQGVSPTLPSTSESDLPSQGVLSAMSLPPDRDLPSHGISLPMPPSSDIDLANNAGLLSVPSTSVRDLPTQRFLVTSPQTSESEGLSLSPQISERMYMAQTSNWSQTLPLTLSEIISPTSERFFMATTSQQKYRSTTLQRTTDSAMVRTSERVYMPLTSLRADNIGPNVGSTSQRVDPTVHPNTERVYMQLQTSHQNDGVGPTNQRTEPTSYQTSDRAYMFAISQGNEDMGRASEGTDMATRASSDTVDMSATTSKRNHLVGSSSRMDDGAMHPTSERIYMSTSHRNDSVDPTSQRTDVIMPSTSERMYMPSNVPRNPGLPSSESLYMPATSQRLFTQNPMISMDEFPGQGASLNLPTSQRR